MTITKKNIMTKPYYKDLFHLFEEFHDTSLTSAIIEQIMVKDKDINKLIYNDNQSQLKLWNRTIEFFKNSKNRERLKKLIDDGRINPNSISSKRQMLKLLNKMTHYKIEFLRKERLKKSPVYKINKIFYIDFIKKFSQVSRDVLEDANSEHFVYRDGTFKEIDLSKIKKMKNTNVMISFFGGKNLIGISSIELKSIIEKIGEEHHQRLEEKFPLTSSDVNIQAYESAMRCLTPVVLQIIIF